MLLFLCFEIKYNVRSLSLTCITLMSSVLHPNVLHFKQSSRLFSVSSFGLTFFLKSRCFFSSFWNRRLFYEQTRQRRVYWHMPHLSHYHFFLSWRRWWTNFPCCIWWVQWAHTHVTSCIRLQQQQMYICNTGLCLLTRSRVRKSYTNPMPIRHTTHIKLLLHCHHALDTSVRSGL